MSTIGFCSRGGMNGVKVTKQELLVFARQNKRRFIDEVIPLPHGNASTCPDETHEKAIDDVAGNLIYFEDEEGGHGWCCNKCGEVVQWG